MAFIGTKRPRKQQELSSTSAIEPQFKLKSYQNASPFQFKLFSMAEEVKPVEKPVDYKRLFRNVRWGHWCEAKEFLTLHPSAITATDSDGDTALHIAADHGHEQIVEELVQFMTEVDLERKNSDGETALTIAAAKNIKIVECLVAKNKNLIGIAKDFSQMTPILIAVVNHRWDIVRYLYSLTPFEDLPCGSELLSYYLQAKQFGIHIEHAPSVGEARINVQHQENEQGHQRNSTVFGLLQGLPSRLSESLGINNIRDLKLLHVRSLELLDSACDVIQHLNNEEMMKYKLYETVFNAVENGIFEIVISLCTAKPELLDRKRQDEKSIFDYAIECRQEKVYSLIYGVGKRNYFATLKNSRGQSMLYYAGMLSPLAKAKLDLIPGAALQMQRERQWYKEREGEVRNFYNNLAEEEVSNPECKDGQLEKEVESMVTAPGPTPFKEDGLTAARLFTENHKELHEKGEKWMKDTASSYIIVSALVITIMFAAAFTVPGGNNQDTGFPMFLNEKLFMVFLVSDAISLFSSVTSALMFLSILTSRYAEDDFLKSLPTKMIIGLSTLFISVATMMVAFSSTIFLMLRDKSSISTPIIFLAGVPVILFVWMQFPLLLEIFVSTYGKGIFDRKVERWI